MKASPPLKEVPAAASSLGKEGRSWWLAVVLLSCFAGLLALNMAFQMKPGSRYALPSLWERARKLSGVTNDIRRDELTLNFSSTCRAMDHVLPATAKVFYANALGEESYGGIGFYFFQCYYLYPRAVDISVGQRAFLTNGPPPNRATYYSGQVPNELAQLQPPFYHVVTAREGGNMRLQFTDPTIGPFHGNTPENENPARQLYPYTRDLWLAFLLPVWVAWLGAGIFRGLWAQLYPTLGWGERAAGGLALGVMAISQLAFGLRLLGCPLEWVVWGILPVWSAIRLIRSGKAWRREGFVRPNLPRWHWAWLGLAPVGALFVLLLYLAGQTGLTEFDAVAGWMFKAKLIFHNGGRALVDSFSNPAWGHAHLDYPPLVPMLHALTFGAIGRVNEFVTKFWAAWFLGFLILGSLSACQWPRRNGVLGLALAWILAFVPLTVVYSQMEGATMPLTFFVVLAFVLLGLGITELNRDRLTLGLALLGGAALCKQEGGILLALWLALLLGVHVTRQLFLPAAGWRKAAGFVLACALPYVIFRAQIPTLHPEAHWPAMLREYPGHVLAQWPKLLLALVSRLFAGDGLAHWETLDNGHLAWQPHWAGLYSLFDSVTMNVAWVGVVLVVFLWQQGALNRRAALLSTGAFVGYATLLALVIAALPANVDNLSAALAFAGDETGTRYLAPAACAWLVASAVLLARKNPEKI